MPQDQTNGPIGTSRREKGAGGPGVASRHDDGCFRTHRIHHCLDLVGERLPGRQSIERNRVGCADAPSVEADDAAEAGELQEERSDVGLVPVRVERAPPADGEDDVGGAVADDLVGDALVAEHGVPGAGFHCHRLFVGGARAPGSGNLNQCRPPRREFAAGGEA